MPHCAPTYAAILALSIVAGLGGTVVVNTAGEGEGEGDGEEGCNDNSNTNDNNYMPYSIAGKQAQQLLTSVRLKLYAFFLSLRVTTTTTTTTAVMNDTTTATTAFRMQHDGEIDVRATYCILAPCHLLQLIDNDNNTTATTTTTTTNTTPAINPLHCLSIARHIASCQTYEGGFGAESYNEAHGGYAFCAIASLHILNKLHMINSNTFLYWACSKQLSYEGGFAGRTNKLVDGCYSFWQGGAIVIMNNYLQQQCDVEQEEEETDSSSSSNEEDDEWNKNNKVVDEEDEQLNQQHYLMNNAPTIHPPLCPRCEW